MTVKKTIRENADEAEKRFKKDEKERHSERA